MRPTPGLVGRTLRQSVVDGPGNRFVVFLQGCNFNCFNCHNPQTINLCDSCGVCVDYCDQGALEVKDGLVSFEPSRCDGCDLCIDYCPSDSSPMVVGRTTVDLLAEMAEVELFISGVTVSGGEPTLQLAFLVDFFSGVRERFPRMSTFVDTNGSLDKDGWILLLPHLSGAMVDLKAATPETHHRITGQDNSAVIDSIRLLAAERKLEEVRLLVIEGLTDSDAELDAYASVITGIDSDIRLKLMAFRHHGVRVHGRAWPETSIETMQRVEAKLARHGLNNLVSTPVL